MKRFYFFKRTLSIILALFMAFLPMCKEVYASEQIEPDRETYAENTYEASPEESVSSDAALVENKEEDINNTESKEDEIVSENKADDTDPEQTVSEDEADDKDPEQTVSGNEAEDTSASENNIEKSDETVSEDNITVSEDVVYAGGEQSYTIEYNGNGATSGTMEDSVCVVGESCDLTANKYTKKGYHFTGWNTRADGKGTDYTDEEQFEDLSAEEGVIIVLYAQWSVNEYVIRYNGNRSTSGKMEDTAGRKYDKTYKLKANAYKRAGYSFNGWNTKSDGKGKAYANKASVKNLSVKDGKTVILYAQWMPVKYTIAYKLNGGKNNSKNPKSYTVTTGKIKLASPSRSGFKFLGWFSEAKFKNKVTAINKGSTGNKILYAKWTANTYTIRFDGNGADSGSMNDMSGCRYGDEYTLRSNKFGRLGYKFTGWNTKKNGSGKSYSNKEKVKNLSSKDGASVTLYAQWKKLDDEATIWNYLYSKTGNEYGTAGMMGNLYAESSLRSNNLQNTYNKKFNVSDEEYTELVDSGRYNNFAKDSAGYGLAQWTYHTRKQGLLDYAKSKGKSIGDIGVQLEYLWKELTEGYKSVLNTLKSAKSVKEASDKVLTVYERPADQSNSVKNKRAGFGRIYYNKYGKK